MKIIKNIIPFCAILFAVVPCSCSVSENTVLSEATSEQQTISPFQIILAETAPSEEEAAQSRGKKESELYHSLENNDATGEIKQVSGENLKLIDFTDCSIAALDNYGVKIYERLSDEKTKEFIDCITDAEISPEEYGELPKFVGGTLREFQIVLNTSEIIYIGTWEFEDTHLIIINGEHGYTCDKESLYQIRECYQEIYKRFVEKAWQQ
ncbi:MAG: hypothetical protein HDT46_02060 [Ruminococcaceae bacterium]|nr:hypothetical protein [Oscillospiraceae bacterium]